MSASARIGSVFARAAIGPVGYAASCITANKIPVGLDELAPEGLVGAFRRGLEEVARLAAVPVSDVERSLPMGQLAALEERLRVSQPAAVRAWKMFAGQFGFLDVITALTVDGRRPDIDLCLERLAGKVRADKELSLPLRALAQDMAAWTELLERTQETLEQGAWLAAALRRRQLVRFGLMGLGLLAVVAMTAGIVLVRTRRTRVDARLSEADPCSVEALTPAELDYASSSQLGAVGDKRDACAAKRAAEERARKEAEAVAAKRAAEERARAERITACQRLASELEKGTLSPQSRAAAGDAAPLAERIATRALIPADLGPDDAKRPCSDTPSLQRIDAAFATAMFSNDTLWTRQSDPSPYMHKLVVARKGQLSARLTIGLADQAERTSKQALIKGLPELRIRALRLCHLADDLGVFGLLKCEAVKRIEAQRK